MDEKIGPEKEQKLQNENRQDEVQLEDDQLEYSFMQETIKDEAGGKSKIRDDIWRTVGLGLIFGIVASFSFCAVKPWMESKFQKDPQTVTIPDEEEDEDTAEEEAEEPVVQQVLDENSFRQIQQSLTNIATEAEKSVVEVVGVTGGQEWMTESYDNTNSISGLIVADNGRELLIFGKNSVSKDGKEIHVIFPDGAVCPATMKKQDASLGFGIYAVSRSEIPESTWTQFKTATLGSSSTAKKGETVIVLGKSFGYTASMGFGIMSSNKNTVDNADGRYHLVCTDIAAAENGTGVIVNLNGEVIGLIDQSISEGDSMNLVTGYGISDLKSIIECLSNGQAVPYIGIRGLDITDDIEAQGIPKGVYVREVEPDSPAMAAGIQSGDVITSIGDTSVTTLSAYHSALLEEKSGNKIKLKGQRQGAGGYVDIEFNVTIGSNE